MHIKKTKQPGFCRSGILLPVAAFIVMSICQTVQANYVLNTGYQNRWFFDPVTTNSSTPSGGPYSNYFGPYPVPAQTNASTVFYHGNVGPYSSDTNLYAPEIPANSHFQLTFSSFGQPVEGLIPDFNLGDTITPVPGANSNVPPAGFRAVAAGNNTNAYYESVDGGAFWSPSTHRIYAAQPNNIEIDWIMNNGSTNTQVYMISAVPAQRPARLFWTESPYDAPPVDLSGLFPVIHYNSEIPPPVLSITTNVNGGVTNVTTNVIAGVWLDGQKQMKAIGVTGIILVEYYKTGTYDEQVEPEAIEIVEVLPPQVQTRHVDIGTRLLPRDSYWRDAEGEKGLIANIQKGLQDGYAFMNTMHGPKDGWVWAVKTTTNDPWRIEIYWEHEGLMSVNWPYEVDWYSAAWPDDPPLVVYGASEADTAPVIIPHEYTPSLQYEEPDLNTVISDGGHAIYAKTNGYALLKYSTQNSVWFESIKAVRHNDPVYFDPEPVEWSIGEELLPLGRHTHALEFSPALTNYALAHKSFINKRPEWTFEAWVYPASTNSGTIYSEGNPLVTFEVTQSTDNRLHVGAWNQHKPSNWMHFYTDDNALTTGEWNYISVTLEDGGVESGLVTVAVNDNTYTGALQTVDHPRNNQAVIGANSWDSPNNSFDGAIERIRLWNKPIDAEDLWHNRFRELKGNEPGLLADFPCNEGTGDDVLNTASIYDAVLYNNPEWIFGLRLPNTNNPAWPAYPGYIHRPIGKDYNHNRYTYPSEAAPDSASYIFAVNTCTLEVWWAESSKLNDLPTPIYYPSLAQRYNCIWPRYCDEIVIASGKGSNGRQGGTALYFNSDYDYAYVPQSSALNFDTTFTVEAWVNLEDPDRDQKIVCKSSPKSAGYILGVNNAKLYAEVWDTDETYFQIFDGTIPENEWTHLAITFDPDGDLIGYINGIEIGRTSTAGKAVKYTSQKFTIGRASWSNTKGTRGDIDDVRIWSTARTSNEIVSAMHEIPDDDKINLAAWYPMEEGAGSAIYDHSDHNLDCWLFNIEWAEPGRPHEVEYPDRTWVGGSPSVYYQNDPDQDGYNPNEEHALIMGSSVYALRNDLNGVDSSEPFVLVDYLDPDSSRPAMHPFKVYQENAYYSFDYDITAGTAIVPPMPVGAQPICTNNACKSGPGWRDRKYDWWAKAAGNDGGEDTAVMHFYYTMQPSFYFPGLAANQQPAIGSEVPWLPYPSRNQGADGTPIDMNYHITWPENVPEMKIAETLTSATRGLPDIWDQLSVQILYQQSLQNSTNRSVTLIDPVVEKGTPLDFSIIQSMEAQDLAKKETLGNNYYFPTLPPSLYSRIYYNPDMGSAGQLVIEGQRISPLTGPSYLLLNMLDDREVQHVLDVGNDLTDADKKTAWNNAVNDLPRAVTLIYTNQPYVHAALSAGLGSGDGYVTLAFNNSTNTQQVAPGLPISLSVIKVIPELYNGILEPIEPENALDEKFSMRYGADFSGEPGKYDFQWRWTEPVGGLIPNTNFLTSTSWEVYESLGDITNGALTVNIEGGGQFTLADHYFAVRYRLHDPDDGPTGTNWSEWVYNLAPGWIDRVVNGITPYEQRLSDMVADPADTTFSLISQAGPPYEGPVALNMDYINDVGLIQIYETVLERAKSMSLDTGTGGDDAVNQSLLNVVSRINDLYMVLGNEAYADALDPTIAISSDDDWLGLDNYSDMATGLFAFENQVPSLLEEELALLRGRDNTLEPSTDLSPVFNRLIWNYTRDISGGEVVYSINYNIKGNPTNLTGTLGAEDAKRLYPQGHGDAWGHYLSALKGYYDLLGNENFGWQTEPGAMLIGNAAVSVDYFDERKFAESASSKARTGVELLNRTYKSLYTYTENDLWQDYSDSDTNRAWGLDGWASRVGQGAYFDWLTGNSLLLFELTNMAQVAGTDGDIPEGIQKIDRTTVPELQEIASSLHTAQQILDDANSGHNPLGLPSGAVPFDISPAEIDAGKTHFEQIYERAVAALKNAQTVFLQIKGCTRDMRAQADTIYERQQALAEQELDFHNRLIEIYGQPYTDDVGPGKTYPQGYEGPDLINYQIIELDDIMAFEPDIITPLDIDIYRYEFSGDFDIKERNEDYSLDRTSKGTTTVWLAENGFKVKPASWTGQRPAYGELQIALADLIQSFYHMKAQAEYYGKLMEWIDHSYDYLKSATDKELHNLGLLKTNTGRIKDTADYIRDLTITKNVTEIVGSFYYEAMRAYAHIAPTEVEGVIGPFPYAGIRTGFGGILRRIGVFLKYLNFTEAHAYEAAISSHEARQKRWDADLEYHTETNKTWISLEKEKLEFEESLRQQLIKESELIASIEAFHQAYERYTKLEKQGELLMAKRAQVRAQFAHRIQENRYADMAFRIFRNEALQKYTAAFDLAAKYTWFAAKAYDYETALLDTDAALSPGSKFLTDIVKARTIGVMTDGIPQPGGSHYDPGLADILARMKADWDVVKTRFGFNNPDTETSRFSLRSELFRISPSHGSDSKWQDTLKTRVIDDLNEYEYFRRYCKPFTSSTDPQPAIVIPFDSSVIFGKNFFGKDLAGGDNAYDSSHQATKIRSAGIWFTGYNVTFNTNDIGSGLANEPRVYLIPVGEDVMRTPTGDHDELRHWNVIDQVIPLPYNVGGTDIDGADWVPVYDSLSETIGRARRFASLRAYHDRGQFVEEETHNNGRLIGRSVWNTHWELIIPGGTLLNDPDEGIQRFIYGAKDETGKRDGRGIKDIKIFFQTYSVWGE